MTGEEKIGLLANLDRLKAQERLHLGKYDPADYRGVYALTLLATESKELATRAQSGAAELFAERKMSENRQ